MSRVCSVAQCTSTRLETKDVCGFHAQLIEQDNATKVGTKFDAGKRRWDPLPIDAVGKIVDIITFGAKKYEPNNWKRLQNHEDRYFAALMRHLERWRSGEKIDPETGMSHLAHAGCNLVFLLWFEDHSPEVPR